MGMYIFYGIAVIFMIVSSIILIIKKHLVTPMLVLINTIMSLALFWLYADANHYWTVVCDESNGCMNETGLFFAISLFFIILAIIILVSSLSIQFVMRLTKKQSSPTE